MRSAGTAFLCCLRLAMPRTLEKAGHCAANAVLPLRIDGLRPLKTPCSRMVCCQTLSDEAAANAAVRNRKLRAELGLNDMNCRNRKRCRNAAGRVSEVLIRQPLPPRSGSCAAMFHAPPATDVLLCSYAAKGVDQSTTLLTGSNVSANFSHCNGYWTLFTTNVILTNQAHAPEKYGCCDAA
jgi:hypothetical protein